MHPPDHMTTVEGGKRYSVSTATLLAGNDYWDGNNFERRGRNQFLYRSPRGRYFFVHLTQWQGEMSRIEPCGLDDAISFYESCREDDCRVSYEDAFPGVEVEEA